MYSKANFRTNEEIIIPENYKGNAFFGRPLETPDEENSLVEAIAEENTEQNAVALNTIDEPKPHQDKKTNSLLAPFIPPKVSNPSGFLNNVGLEELLILGVLILLSQSDADDDILLLLFLLLFYK